MKSQIHPQIRGNIESFEFCESELVIGLVYAVGTNYKPVQESLEAILRQHGYNPKPIRISDLISSLTQDNLENDSEISRVFQDDSWQQRMS